jgi:predicted unusual protein kinase regulating ubiquinone biosynthesis (AarF/ABC1/UbiB family)
MAEDYAGPYTGGPPPDALRVSMPSLYRFGPAELLRIVVVVAVLGAYLLLGAARWALRSRWLPRRDPADLAALRRALAEAAVDAFTRLGPTFVKLGQLMASSPGLFPAELSEAARRCLDDLPPFPAEQARALLERRLGRPVSGLFREFGDTPLAAASIAQVHACVLPDGREAVVKLRRPGIRRRIVVDLRIMHVLAGVLDRYVELARLAGMVGVVEQLHLSSCRELNFALEAHHQQRFRDALPAFGDNKQVTAPEVYWEYCAPDVICMERMHGIPLDDAASLAEAGASGELPLRRGVKAWLEAAIVHGPFHGDAHAGNIWLLRDGRIAYLDFGIVGELEPRWRALVRDALYTIMFDRDFERVARALRECGVLEPGMGNDRQVGWALSAMFGPVLDAPMHRMNSRQIIDMVVDTARRYSGENPAELTLFTKQLLYFERYSAELAPHWVLGTDPYVVRNLFPAEADERAERLGVPMPD